MDWHERQESRILHEVAEEFGLRFTPRELTSSATLSGEIDAHPVRLVGARSDDTVRLGGWAGFVPPLDLGLQVFRRGTLSMIGAGFRQQSQFELEFEVEADEPARAEALLRPPLQAALLSPGATMDDLGLASSVIGEGLGGLPGFPKPQQVIDLLRSLVQTARLVEQSCLQVPEAAVLAGHAKAWASMASRRDFRLLRTPLQLHGIVGRCRMFAGAQRSAPNTYSIAMTASFESPLGIGLSVRPEGFLDKLRSIVQPDISLADPQFDPLYRVACSQPAVAPGILDPEVRAGLCSVAKAGAVARLSDEALTVSSPAEALSPENAVEVFERIAAVASRIHDNATRATRNGPYR